MPIVLTSTPTSVLAFDGEPSNRLLIGRATLGPHGVWTVQAGGVVRHRWRRRSATRTLRQLSAAVATRQTLARARFARREDVGGGVRRIPTGGAS